MALSGSLKNINLNKNQIDMLRGYSKLILEANRNFNLIAKSTEELIWERHIHDSAQLAGLIPKNAKSFCDVGSGAGLPGLVIKIINKSLDCFLVEPIKKKADFLKSSAKGLGLDVTVAQENYENIKDGPILSADVITARALMPLKGLLKLFSNNIKNGHIGIFPKGRSWEKELNDAKKHWKIKYRLVTSETNKESKILIVEGLDKK
ncbi:MAG: 16S rRNA (guanine(527)-N(7))-methyltransferase RsmG [Hyphomicrobiales bacterium]|nr:16S rRNA (guanine(527)-N(7))-methyltransferase RsmG [Hyphomicrobiales bacterium]MDG2413953.1 16S rRNA (guanine(527)-N(7))-methyltransferase RsmG [Hyphomicrobiales bacterium]